MKKSHTKEWIWIEHMKKVWEWFKCTWIKIVKVLRLCVLPLVVLFVIAFPFILDILYGKGLLKSLFPNSFPADTWFSFIGSYFPAAIIGCLTLYQAYIIQYQDKQYRKLLSQHQFVPAAPAYIYRYDERQNKIGDWTVDQVRQMLTQCEKISLFIDWQKGYILQCWVSVLQGVGIDTVELKSIEWEIHGQRFCQNDAKRIANVIKRTSSDKYQLMVFWQFPDSNAVSDEVIRCMLCGTRQESSYEVSWITLLLQIIDDLGDKSDVRMQFTMQSQPEEIFKIQSVKEKYIVIRGKE